VPRIITLLTLCLCIGIPPSAAAFPTLVELAQAAETWNLDLADADQRLREVQADLTVTRARLLPSFIVAGQYTLNQEEVSTALPTGDLTAPPTEVVFTQMNQVQVTAQIQVPILNLPDRAAVRSGALQTTSAEVQREVVAENLAEALVQAWFQVLVADAVLEQAERSRQTAQDNLDTAAARATAGLATELDVLRAQADVASADQVIADAGLARTLARRNVRTLTGMEVDDAAPELTASLQPSAALQDFMPGIERRARFAQADVTAEQAQAEVLRSRQAWYPTLSAVAQEFVTNASGFNPTAFFSVSLQLNWSLNFGTARSVRAAEVRLEAAELTEERTRRAAEDAVFEAWHTLEARRQRALAVRVQQQAADDAARVARERFSGGTGTQLDVSQAERDAFVARVTGIQADADWLLTLALLQLRSGTPLTEVRL
jgi:outer membrane protein TolC